MGKKMVRSVMKRPWGKSLWLGMVATLSCQAEAPQRFEFEKMGMGTLFRISMVAPDLATAERAAERAFARMDSLEKTLSDWDPASEVRKISQEGGRTRVSDDLWEVLALSIQVARATEGAFDPTVGPAVRLWRRARRQGELPTPADLEAALKRMGWENLEVGDSPWIVLKVSGMRLDLGGVGKGFALDAMLKTLADEGIEAALVDGGGDLAASGPPPGKKGWRVRVDPPGGEGEGRRLLLAHRAVATSGTRFRSFEANGRNWAHLLDPRTGMALDSEIQATVVASSGALADAMASAACILGPEGWETIPPRGDVEVSWNLPKEATE